MDIAPTLFYIDISKSYAESYFQDDDGKHRIAADLYRKGMFDPSYTLAGRDMMSELVENNHPPSLVYAANKLMKLNRSQIDRDNAIHYYESAALQGYSPAIKELASYQGSNIAK